MSFSEALKFAEGARKKIIREWAEENCFGQKALMIRNDNVFYDILTMFKIAYLV